PDFRGAWLRDERVHALAARITVESSSTDDENAMEPQTIEVTLKDGRRHAVVLHHVLGHPRNPLPRAQHLDKLARNLGYGPTPLPGARPDAGIRRTSGRGYAGGRHPRGRRACAGGPGGARWTRSRRPPRSR